MIDYTTISRVYFIGIGGIGMSALARYFLQKNAEVYGYDRAPSQLCRQLEAEGAVIHYEDDITQLYRQAELVIYTPAIPASHNEMNWYKDHEYLLAKRSDVLSQVTANTFNISIAGTHGKTTISAMVAHILRDSGYGCQALLGGISSNYQTNFWNTNNDVTVVEADEYDRSFLKLSPDIAVISAMDADHLDIYHTVENMRQAFESFAAKIKPGGYLYTRFGIGGSFFSDNHLSYSLQNSAADIYGVNITMQQGGYTFDVIAKDWIITDLQLAMGGMHNVENAIVSVAIARQIGIDTQKIREAIAGFKGVKRRFEYLISPSEAQLLRNNVVYIDDYAHHPEELKALINSAKSLFRDRKCTVVFQPHLFTRTRDLAADFAQALDPADEILLLPIYPAREQPIDGVTSVLILDKLANKNSSVVSPAQLLEYINGEYLKTAADIPQGNLLITAGAGSIDSLSEPIKKILLQS